MHITVEPQDGYSVLHLRGEFDTFYCPALQQEIDGLQAAGVHRVVLNLRLVKFINSTALGAIIKASKALSGQGGQLVIARPSNFCRDIMEKVGLDRVVPILGSDEEAGAAVMESARKAAEDDNAPFEEDEAAVMFSPVDPERVEHFIPESKRTGGVTNPVHGHSFGKSWRGIGRMSGLDSQGLRFTWGGGQTSLSPFEMGQMLSIGIDLKIKFRLPLLQKGHCEAVVTIDEVEERPDGVKLGATFSEIDDETRQAVQQYSEDMAFLKDELRKATES